METKLFIKNVSILCVIACSFALGSPASGQHKIDTKWHCPNVSANHELPVGDVPDHSYAILQGTCSAVSNSGLPEKTAAYTEFVESWKESNKFFGRWNVTLQDGDQIFYSYEGAEQTGSNKPVTDHWKISAGTGKYEKVRGSGTCTGQVHEDGSSDWECVGGYSSTK